MLLSSALSAQMLSPPLAFTRAVPSAYAVLYRLARLDLSHFSLRNLEVTSSESFS